MAAALDVLTFDGEAAGQVELKLRTARKETAKAVVHRGVVTELQNRRRGTASTLTRAEVRGGGRKPYKQKGTGRARIGSSRTPLKPGGGVVFGPKPKDWSIKINRKEKQLAISTALQSAAVHMKVIEDDFGDKFPAPRTRDFVAALRRWGVDERKEYALLFAVEIGENALKSARNIERLKVITPRTLNLYDVLRADKVLVTREGVNYLNEMYGEEEWVADDDEDEEEGAEEVGGSGVALIVEAGGESAAAQGEAASESATAEVAGTEAEGEAEAATEAVAEPEEGVEVEGEGAATDEPEADAQ